MAGERTDPVLLEGFRSGEPAAFREVYEAYRPPLFRFLLRMSGDRALAEDLLQETWIRAARRCRSLAADTELDAWLYTIARNLFISHQRWAGLRRRKGPELARTTQGSTTSPTPFEHASATELSERLERALLALPLRLREVIVLVVVEGLEPREAALVLAVEPGALRQRLKRARDALRAALGDAAEVAGG